MPVVHPAEVWQESGRYAKIGPELARFKDRGERDMVLAMTHEEVVAILLRDIVRSYRQLPIIVYHFQTKFRDEPRARGGLIRVREFVMKDSYTCDRRLGRARHQLLRSTTSPTTRIFERLGLDAIAVRSDVGIMGGTAGPRVHGPQRLRRGHARPVRQLRLRRQPADRHRRHAGSEPRRTSCRSRRSRRPDATTIEALATFLDVPKSRTAKATFFVTGDGRFVVAIVRGDFDVNETKLVNRLKAVKGLRPATVDEIQARGMEPGYGSPIGARDAIVVVDELVAESHRTSSPARTGPAGTCGTSTCPATTRPDHDRRHRERPRGRPVPQLRRAGDPSQGDRGRQHLQARHGLTRTRSASLFLGEDGERHPIVMGSYGIGLGRNVACIVEAHHDEKGIAWPEEVAPYRAHLVAIGGNKDPQVLETAERLYALAEAAGPDREILYDDREESPGVKFTDAELLGMPWILTVSPRSLAAGGVEVTNRATGERGVRSLDDVTAFLEGRAPLAAGA